MGSEAPWFRVQRTLSIAKQSNMETPVVQSFKGRLSVTRPAQANRPYIGGTTSVPKIFSNLSIEMTKSDGTKSRGWVYTHHIDTDDIDQQLLILERLLSIDSVYHIIAHEFGENGDTYHFQGFVYFKNARRFNSVKTMFLSTTHIEAQKGTCTQSIYYCMKEGVYFEYGERPQPGKRTDLHIIYKDIENGKSVFDIKRQYPVQYAHYFRTIDIYHQEVTHNKKKSPLVVLYKCTSRKASYDLVQLLKKFDKTEVKRMQMMFSIQESLFEEYYSGKYSLIVLSYGSDDEVRGIIEQFSGGYYIDGEEPPELQINYLILN